VIFKHLGVGKESQIRPLVPNFTIMVLETQSLTAVLWAPPGEYMARYVGTAYCSVLTVDVRLSCSCIFWHKFAPNGIPL